VIEFEEKKKRKKASKIGGNGGNELNVSFVVCLETFQCIKYQVNAI
jgi:hypothetical protein